MSYLLECQVCHHRLEVEDPAAPTGPQCPTCASFYSFLPVRERPQVVLSSIALTEAVDRPPAAPAVAAAEATVRSTDPTLVAQAPPPAAFDGPRLAILVDKNGVPVHKPEPPATVPAKVPRRVPLSSLPQYEPPQPSVLLVATGPLAIVLGLAGLICVWVSALNGWAAPLCAVGLFVASAGVFVDDGTDRSRFVPSSAAALCGLFLLVALFPGIGSTFGIGRPRSDFDPTAFRVVPLTGDAVDPTADDAGWIDASRAAVQQNRVGIQIISAMTGPTVPRQLLTIRLRVQRIWAGDQNLAAEAEREEPLPMAVPQASLTDDAGRPCQPVADGAASAPGETLLTFEAPTLGYKFLRLELPAATWGGSGSFKFKIPSTMIRPDTGPGNRPGQRGGPQSPSAR